MRRATLHKRVRHWCGNRQERCTFKTRWALRAGATFLLCLIGCLIAIEAATAATTADFHISAQENAIFLVYLIFSAWGSSASAGLRKHGNSNSDILRDFFAGWGFGFCLSGVICETIAQKWLNGVSLMAIAVAVSGIAGAGIVPLLQKLDEKGALDRAADWILRKGKKDDGKDA